MAFLKKPLKWTALGQEPSELKKSEGFKMDESPAPGHFDFMFRSTYEAIEELQQKAGEVKTINNTLPNAAGNISVTKSTVGLSNVDNTSDANKPISNATKTELDKKYAKPTTGIPKTDLESSVQTSLTKAESALQSVTKADIGLGNVDNTSDADKPISNAQQAEFNKKANLASPVFTGTPTVPTASEATNSTVAASTAFVNRAVATHKADNVSHDTYVSCVTTGATAEKVVTANGFTLVEGARITVKFVNANTATVPTLKINTELAKPLVKADGTAFKNIKAGIYSFVYSGTSFTLLGEGGEYGTATASDVRKTKTFGTENGVQQGTLDLANLVSSNLKKGVTIDGITGTLDVASLGGKKYSSGTGITNFSNGSFSITSLTFTPSVIYVFDTQGTYAIYFFGNRTSNGVNMNFSSVTSNGFSIATTVYSWSFTWIAYE